MIAYCNLALFMTNSTFNLTCADDGSVNEYVCMYVRMYVCTYVCMYVCMYVSMYVFMDVCMYVCVCIYVCVCMYLCMYLCIYVCLHVVSSGNGSYWLCAQIFNSKHLYIHIHIKVSCDTRSCTLTSRRFHVSGHQSSRRRLVLEAPLCS